MILKLFPDDLDSDSVLSEGGCTLTVPERGKNMITWLINRVLHVDKSIAQANANWEKSIAK